MAIDRENRVGETGSTQRNIGNSDWQSSQEQSDLMSEGLKPFTQLLDKYGGELRPFLADIGFSLRAGANALESKGSVHAEGSSSRSSAVVSNWLISAADYIDDIEQRLTESSPSEVIDYINELGTRHPGALFGVSYVLGAFFARAGKHVVRSHSEGDAQSDVPVDLRQDFSAGQDFSNLDSSSRRPNDQLH